MDACEQGAPTTELVSWCRGCKQGGGDRKSSHPWLPTGTSLLPRSDPEYETSSDVGFQEEAANFVHDETRAPVEQTISRIPRDRVFRKLVLDAYDCRCAITGLKLINGSGRAEVEAAVRKITNGEL